VYNPRALGGDVILTFDPAKFVSEIEGLGAEVGVVVAADGSATIHPKYLPNARKVQIDALWNKEMASPERRHAVAKFLRDRDG
jgi:hypothetical protein